MASIKSGSIVSDIRGKVGTEIYSRNKFGSYVKSYAVPVQPGTAFQDTAQDRLATCIASWQSLSDADRLAWNDYAGSVSFSNGVGLPSKLSGYNLFVSRKMNLLVVDQTINPSLGPGNSPPNFNIFISTSTTVLLRVTVTSDSAPNNFRIVVMMSPPVSSGVMSPNSTRYDFIDYLTLTPGESGSLLSAYTARFGALTGLEGMKIFLKARLIRVGKEAPFIGPTLRDGQDFGTYFYGFATIT